MPLRVGFIGLGNIGSPMARNIVASGYPLIVYDTRSEACAELAADGASVAQSAAEVGAGSEIICLCVRDDAQVNDVVFGSHGIDEGVRRGSIVAIHSTIRPSTVLDVARKLEANGVGVVDAPMTGGAGGAHSRNLCYMAGGDEQLLERCRPVFETSASRIVHTGVLGTGAATKLCNNLMMYMGFLAAHEATELAARTGVPREVLREVTRANGVMTPPMEAFLGLGRQVGEQGLSDALRQMIESFAALADKDLDLAVQAGHEAGIALRGAERCRELMRKVYGLSDD